MTYLLSNGEININMEKLFLSSSTKKVLNLETELVKELKELKEEIEDAESLYSLGGKPFR